MCTRGQENNLAYTFVHICYGEKALYFVKAEREEWVDEGKGELTKNMTGAQNLQTGEYNEMLHMQTLFYLC